MRIGIFEDSGYKNLQPLTYLRPVFDLRCGALLLREKIEKRLTSIKIDYFTRKILVDFLCEIYIEKKINHFVEDDYLFLNGRVLFKENLLNKLITLEGTQVFKKSGDTVAAFIKKQDLKKLGYYSDGTLNFDTFLNTQEINAGVNVLKYFWDLINRNAEEITNDLFYITNSEEFSQKPRTNIFLLNQDNIYITPSARIDPGVVLNAETGPIIIEHGVHIYPQTTIIGPAFVGKNSVLKIGAKIYEGTSIGEVCKIGGELENSIIHSYSNKQHDGFLGHSYLGKWVNLGADTNNSDLKNNYGSVRVTINGNEINSESTFVGLAIGDHSKSGINTMFNTGTVVGIMCNVFGSDFQAKWIPSFTWGTVEYQIDKAISVAEKVMARRDVILGRAEKDLISSVFIETKKFRDY